LPARVCKFLQRIYRFNNIVRRERPDCVISFMGEPNLINTLVSKNPIVTVHSSIAKNYRRLSGKIFRLLIPFCYNRARVVVVSQGIKDELVKCCRVREDRISVIYNPVDMNKIASLAGEAGDAAEDEGIPIVITSGRLTEEKGQWHLLRAFSHVRKVMPCKLMILGQGHLDGYLRNLSKELKIEKDTYFLGWQKNPFKYLAHAKLFVMSFLWEGFGIALVEAMACNLPVISTDCQSGPREILLPKTGAGHRAERAEHAEFGVLVPPCDGNLYDAGSPLTKEERILAESIISMLSDKELLHRYSSTGLRRAFDFDIAKVTAKYVDLIKETCGCPER